MSSENLINLATPGRLGLLWPEGLLRKWRLQWVILLKQSEKIIFSFSGVFKKCCWERLMEVNNLKLTKNQQTFWRSTTPILVEYTAIGGVFCRPLIPSTKPTKLSWSLKRSKISVESCLSIAQQNFFVGAQGVHYSTRLLGVNSIGRLTITL